MEGCLVANDVIVDARELLRFEKSLEKAGINFEQGHKKLFNVIGAYVQGLARKYCPESITKAMYVADLEDGVTMRDSSSFTTGSLRDSIKFRANKDSVSIFVPSNSRGGMYAEKIHDKKGSAWKVRGQRTRQKGQKSDEKFIFRAGEDSEKKIDELIDKALSELIRDI